ncbi:hypothetical protein DSO57_1005132 [Entomophthora muscae]|uniref:Uncharacterized protein n=1 Tax=Entomophthora muscae TaxID=34485 RepID=A0ACC2RZ34_9FUNG|nr:hypothetical protein DSO57_1005132 [Entomophthora muscae]
MIYKTLVVGCGVVAGCGMAVHIEVTHRALGNLPPKYDNYHDAINRNLQAVEAGSFFPDWGYNCFKMGEASEEAHWPTFYLNAVAYIQETYPAQLQGLQQGLKGEARFERLLAFLFGVVSHGTADITWHSLDSNAQGFIDTSGKRDWSGKYSKAHSVADIGAEFVLARANDLDYFQRVWTTPVDDILAIYQRMSVANVTSAKLLSCMGLGYSGAHGVRIAGKRVLGRFDTDKSPFLLMNYESYFRGGLMNMASWVGFCWCELIEWLESDGTKRGFCSLQFPKYTDITLSHPIRSSMGIQSIKPVKRNEVMNEHDGDRRVYA